jgi:hypothetical protein
MMKKQAVCICVIGIIGVFLLVCSCASSKPSVGDIAAALGPDESVLIFYRGALHFAAPPYTVYVDGIERFSLKANQSGRLVVPNGVHEFVGVIQKRRNTKKKKKVSVKSEEVTFEIKADWVDGYSDINIDFIEKQKNKLR